MAEPRDFRSFAGTVFALPGALGTGILIHTAQPVPERKRRATRGFVSRYEQALSRFRADSLVARIAREGAGDYEFPDWAAGLFRICDVMSEATGGRFDPCVGEDLARLGYGPAWSFPAAASASPGGVQKDAEAASAGARSALRAVTSRTGVPGLAGGARRDARRDDYGGPLAWGEAVTHTGPVLHVKAPVLLDFGAVGKGLLVDLLAERLIRDEGSGGLVIDAGGDLFTTVPLAIALESPWDATQAVGEARIPPGALCASSPSRRHWTQARTHAEVHHLLDALTGRPVRDIVASWTFVPCETGAGPAAAPTPYPTAWADAQCTALFCGLSHGFPFARVASDGSAALSPAFPGRLFTA